MIIENQKDAEFSSTFKPSQPVQASRFKRWLASMINGLASMINGLVLWVMVGLGFALGDFAGVVGTIVYAGFQLYFMKTYGQTMAKHWLGLRVFNYHTNQPVEFGKYIGREIIDILLAWTSFLLIISGIVALVRDDRRSLTDLVAGTIVLKDEK
ncbi:TPA: RDD family protein [Haemophilus influenzae]